MTEVLLARAPVADGKTDRLRAWFDELADRESEVVDTLDHERVYTETAFVRESEDTDYLFVYMEAEDVAAANAAGNEEVYDVDREHHQVLSECLAGEWEELDTIGHFTNPSLR